MKHQKQVIHIVKHLPTGAEVPVIVTKMDKNNIIQEYHEVMDKRKGFTLKMIENRWDKCREDAIELLQLYQVPGHLKQGLLSKDNPHLLPVDLAIFWEEYIYALEKKAKLSHSKLKSRSFEYSTEH